MLCHVSGWGATAGLCCCNAEAVGLAGGCRGSRGVLGLLAIKSNIRPRILWCVWAELHAAARAGASQACPAHTAWPASAGSSRPAGSNLGVWVGPARKPFCKIGPEQMEQRRTAAHTGWCVALAVGGLVAGRVTADAPGRRERAGAGLQLALERAQARHKLMPGDICAGGFAAPVNCSVAMPVRRPALLSRRGS